MAVAIQSPFPCFNPTYVGSTATPADLTVNSAHCCVPCAPRGDEFTWSAQAFTLQLIEMSVLMALMQQLSRQAPAIGVVPASGCAFSNQHHYLGSSGTQGLNGGMPYNPNVYTPAPPAYPSLHANRVSRAVQVAGSQVGVTGGNKQVRRYTQGRSEPWCADFVSWVYEQSGHSPFGHQPGVAGIRSWGQRNGLYHDRSLYRPHSGDIVVFGNDEHTGIVERVDPDGTVHTIEGNTSGYGRRGGNSAYDGACARHSYSPGSSWLTGYVNMQRFQ